MSDTELRFIEEDDEYMYFEVIHKYTVQGIIYIGKVKPIERSSDQKGVS